MADKTIISARPEALGEILKTRRLVVPPHQREYSWVAKTEVKTLYQDLADAIRDNAGDYFLGTIVLVARSDETFEIVDGQQRLATTVLLLAAMRDALMSGDQDIAHTITSDYLTAATENMRDREPRVRLNLADNSFFESIITKRPAKPTRRSHRLIAEAHEEAKRHVQNIVSQFDKTKHGDVLVQWIKFIRTAAQVILLTISSEGNAYRMFETLNDRGLKTTQADLVKSFLFGRADKHSRDAEGKWATMRGTLEALDEDFVPTVVFLRHALMLRRGYFRENALHDRVQEDAKSDKQALLLLDSFVSLAGEYVALFNPASERWNSYPDATREALRTLNLVSIAGMRPLMMAVAQKFSIKEAAVAFRQFVSWNVRFLIAGTTLTGGYIEVPLANAAKKVADGDISNAVDLTKELVSRIPTDEQFEKAFAEATVSRADLARYYLRALEMAHKAQKDPLFIPREDRESINLEHVLPKSTEGNWPQFSAEEAEADYKRIGNLVLLKAKQNSALRSSPFDVKREVLKEGLYELTIQVGVLPDWNHATIVRRQETLANLAVKTWPI